MCSPNPECGIVDIDNVEAGDDVKNIENLNVYS
jgi:hypothetical protein